MIDTKELRRLTQEATHPVTKGRWMRLFGERTVYDRMEDGCRGIPVVSTPFSPPHPFEAACLDFIAAANPAAISELLDRLEAAEKERDALRAALRHEADCVEAAKAEIAALRTKVDSSNEAWKSADRACRDLTEKVIPNLREQVETAEKERDALRAEVQTWKRQSELYFEKIESMERQEPVAWMGRGPRDGRIEFSAHKPSPSVMRDFNVIPLYTLPGAQPTPSVPDRITPEQAPPEIVEYAPIAAEGYADGWNDCIKTMLAAAPKPEAKS